ncbi:hypothetical protein DL98DRAFT_515707 [Cadophora sp. DSE1049]|nr:hypothetical protein DL98DRAFT_515707 [Cadophora sp. DSE1049]
MEIIEVPTYDMQEVLGLQTGLDGELGLATPPQPPTQDAVPIQDLPCQKNVANDIPKQVSVGGKDISINDLMYGIRQQLCAGPCTAPVGVEKKYVAIFPTDGQVDDICEISVGITDQVEAYFIRETKPDGDQWQSCWDATEVIINKCIDNGPNTGWWNGNHVYQFYQGGMRPLNGEKSKHTDKISSWLSSTPSTTLQPQPPAEATLAPIYPTKFDGSIDCLDRSDGAGTDTSALFWTAGSAIVMGQALQPDITLSTTDKSRCISSGQAKNADGAILNNWCVVYTDGDAAFVIADKYQDWGNGATGQSEIKGDVMIKMASWTTHQCGGSNKAAVAMGGAFSLGQSLNSLCIVNKAHPETCQINWAING